MKLFIINLAAALVSITSAVTPDNVSSRLMVHIPHKLFRAEGYDHREALFGVPPYGGSISTNIFKVRTKLCEATADKYIVDEGWPSPFILMVDRGDCTFVKKVRNAQRLGAAGVVIADNICLCDDIKCITHSGSSTCETSEPIMADDGSGSDISIPSFLMFKRDANIIKEELKAKSPVQLEMAWSLPAPDDRVEYDIWTVPTDVFFNNDFVNNFKDVAVALGKSAYFTPHMYIFDGGRSNCQDNNGMNQCFSLCTNKGRYCATDPDNDVDKGISGADVVKESLRRLCIWKHYGADDGIGVKWWNYLIEFTKSCNKPDKFMNDECVNKAYKRAAIDSNVINTCMKDSGGLATDRPNKLLEEAVKSQTDRGIVLVPTVLVNSAALRGALTVGNVFNAICAGYATDTKPKACQQCEHCNDPHECIKGNGVCMANGTTSKGSVSMPMFITSSLSMIGIFVFLGIWYYKRTRRELRDEVRGLLAEYMPLEDGDDVNNDKSMITSLGSLLPPVQQFLGYPQAKNSNPSTALSHTEPNISIGNKAMNIEIGNSLQ